MCTRFLILCSLVLLAMWMLPAESAPLASTYQVLSPRPGWIPVYIRKGDTPLEEINPQLAEAFRNAKPKTSHQKSLESKSYYDNSVIPLNSADNNEIIKEIDPAK